MSAAVEVEAPQPSQQAPPLRRRRSSDDGLPKRLSPVWLGVLVGGAFVLGLGTGYCLWGVLPAERPLVIHLDTGTIHTVQRVIDGDTVVLENGLHVRYAGVDAPEMGRYVTRPEPCAAAARDRNRQLSEGRRVRLQFERDRIGPYGRVLAHVYLLGPEGGPDIPLGETLVREGLARAAYYRENSDLYPRLKQAENAARKAQVGLWSDTPPAAPRAASGGALPDPSTAPLVASRRGGSIHRRDCFHAQRLASEDRIGYADLEDARASGLPFCRVCRPELHQAEDE